MSRHNPYQRHDPYPDVWALSHTPRATEPYQPRKGDTVELPELLTTEGEAAEISNRIFMGEHRWNLERLWAAADLELADDGGIAPLPRSAP